MEVRPASHNNCQLPICNYNFHKTPLLSVVFFSCCNTWLITVLVIVYPNVLVYHQVFNPLTAYCIFVLVFLCSVCVCHVLNKIYLFIYFGLAYEAMFL